MSHFSLLTSDTASGYAASVEESFNPTIEAISKKIKNSRQKVAGSLKTSIPIITEPTAPIPVHTA